MSYAENTEYAARNLIELITHEEGDLAALHEKLSKQGSPRLHEWDFRTSDLHDDFTEAHVMNAFTKMSAGNELIARIAALSASIAARETSLQALSGALLQIVKQGLSATHGSLESAPIGRNVGGLALKEVVWHARNQSLHYEDGQFSNSVTQVFTTLEAVYGEDFSLSTNAGRNCAKQVVKLLGWHNYEAYRSDLQLLGLC